MTASSRARWIRSAAVALVVAVACPLMAKKRGAAEGRREAIDLLVQGQAFEAQGKNAEAVEQYARSVELAPSPASYYHLGRACAKVRNYTGARQALKQALDLNPDYELAKIELGNLGSKGKASSAPDTDGEESVNVEQLRKQHETANSLLPPGHSASAGSGPSIPAPPQGPPPQNKARRSMEGSDPVVIERDSNPTVISRGNEDQSATKSADEKERAAAEAVKAKPAATGGESEVDKPASQPAPREEEPAETSVLPVAHKGGATAAAVGGSPTAKAINRAAFGPEARQQKPSVGYGNQTKVALGTYAFHRERGDSYRAAKRWSDAAEEYATALRLSPKDSEVRTLLAEVLAKSGQTGAAADQFQKAEAIAPGDPRIAYRQGNAYREQNEPDLAIGAYEKAISLDPRHKFAHNNLGVIYMEKGDYTKALSEFRRVLELDPKYDKAMLNLGIIYDDNLANKDEALKYYEMYVASGGERSGEVQRWIDAIKSRKGE